MGLCVCLFLLGIALTGESKSSVKYNWNEKSLVYIGTVYEKPQEKAKTILCSVEVLCSVDTAGRSPVHRNILLYLAKDSLSRKVKIGDRLLFYGKISAPHNNGNPNEFDYARYLKLHGVSGISYVYAGYWRQNGWQSGGFKQTALIYRERLLDYYKNLGFSGDEYAVLAALTLGSKNDLSEKVREDYSLAGVSHVLALSGLHIGLIYFLISFLLTFVFRGDSFKVFRQCVLIVCLWGFAFLSGLSPSVLRSVTMFSLVAVSFLFNSRPVVINTLAGAAFFMLLHHPFSLFDIGFQLSFLAVFSIVMIQPYLGGKVKVKNRFLRYFSDLVTVSFAAQLGTTPLVIYYFSNFSLLFWFTSLLVIPLVTFILYVTILLLCTAFYVPVQMLVVDVLHQLLEWLNAFVPWISHLPYASLTSLNWQREDVLAFYFILLLVFVTEGLKSHRRQILLMAAGCFLVVYHVADYAFAERKPGIVFYNARNCAAVHFISSGDKSYLLAADRDSVIRKLEYAAGGFWKERGLRTPYVLPSVKSRQKDICVWNGFVRFRNYTVCLIKDNSWKNKTADQPLVVDYLYICDGYKGKIKSLTPLFEIKTVVLDSSLGEYRLGILKEECKRLSLNCVSLSDSGALMVNIV